MEKINITLKSETFLSAGRLIEGPKSPISPFLSDSGANGSEPPAALMSGGVLNPQYKPALQTLAWVKGFGSVAYVSADELLDMSVYHSEPGKPKVALFLADDGVRMEAPANTADVLDWLGQRIGTSLLRKSDFDLAFSYDEARAMFAVVEAARKNALTEIAGMDDSDGVTRQAVISAMVADDDGLQWLASHFSHSHDLAAFGEEQAEQQLMRLAQKGYVILKDNKVTLSDTLADLAEGFLLLSSHLMLKKAEVDQSQQIKATEIRAVQGVNNSFLLWTDDGKQVQMMSASPAQVMRIAFDCLGAEQEAQPDTVSASAPAAPSRMDQSAEPITTKGKKKGKFRWWMIPLILLVLYLIFEVVLWLSV